jgi:hypothetical protein
MYLSEGENTTVTVTEVTPLDPLYSCQFHCDEDILEELNTLDFPWDALHHRALFLSQEAFTPPNQHPIYAIETKYFLLSGHIDWFITLSLPPTLSRKEIWPIHPQPSK